MAHSNLDCKERVSYLLMSSYCSHQQTDQFSDSSSVQTLDLCNIQCPCAGKQWGYRKGKLPLKDSRMESEQLTPMESYLSLALWYFFYHLLILLNISNTRICILLRWYRYYDLSFIFLGRKCHQFVFHVPHMKISIICLSFSLD